MAIAVTATTVTSVYPPRATVSITGLTLGQRVRLYRNFNGKMTPIRGGYRESAGSTSMVVADAEIPMGVNVSWTVRINEQSPAFFDVNSSIYSFTLPGGKVAISDAITGQSAEVTVVAWDRIEFQPESTLFRVGGKNRVVSGGTGNGQFTADVKLVVLSRSSEITLRNLIGSATSSIMQLRRSISNGQLDECYFSVLSYSVERFSDDITDERRFFVLSIAETDSWPYKFVAKGFTLQDLADLYTGQTLADLDADFSTLLSIAQADLS
jgi:hypothetical protein